MCRVCQIVKDWQRITAIVRGFLWCRHQCRQVGPVCFETSTGDGADYAVMQYVVRNAPASIESVLHKCISVTARAFEREINLRFLGTQAGLGAHDGVFELLERADVSVLSGEVDVSDW